MYPDFDEGDEDLIRGYSMDDAGWSVEESRDSEHRQKLNTAAIKVISRALPPQVGLSCRCCPSCFCTMNFSFCPPLVRSLLLFRYVSTFLMRQRGAYPWYLK